MANEIKSWPRPYFASGGGDPLLFYAVFGVFDLTRPLSRSKYRASGMPGWLELVNYNRQEHADVFTSYQSGPLWAVLSRDSPLTANEAERALQCIGIRGEPTDPPTLDYFRDTIGIVAWLLDAGGVAVYDPQMLRLWSAHNWREEAFEPDEPNPNRHTAILVSEDEHGASWYHTRGMRKFGRPDLSVHRVGTQYADGITLLINRFVEHQALGGVIPQGQAIRMKALPPGGICQHRGDRNDPDFNNVHVEIEWPGDGLE